MAALVEVDLGKGGLEDVAGDRFAEGMVLQPAGVDEVSEGVVEGLNAWNRNRQQKRLKPPARWRAPAAKFAGERPPLMAQEPGAEGEQKRHDGEGGGAGKADGPAEQGSGVDPDGEAGDG